MRCTKTVTQSMKYSSLVFSFALTFLVGVLVSLNASPQPLQIARSLDKAVVKEGKREVATEGQEKTIPTATHPPFHRVAFIDETNGWGITNRELWKTNDGGVTWIPQRSASPTGVLRTQGIIDDVQFTSRNVGWLLESYYLLRTRDGGGSWQKMALGDVTVDSCRFFDNENGWCVAQRLHSDTPEEGRRYQAIIYATRNGGESWETQFVSTPGDLYSGFESVHPVSARSVWVVGYEVLHTEDGGKTWEELRIKQRDKLYGRLINVEFADDRTGWMTTNQGGLYLLTNDGGKSWELRSGPHHEGFYDLIYTSPSDAYAAGGGVYKSSDSGRSWRKIIEGDNASYMDLLYLQRIKLVVACGSELTIYALN